jgi:hypothetical protein
MELKQLRIEYSRLIRCPNIKDSYDLLDIYADYFLKTLSNHYSEPVKTVADRDAKMVNHMMLTKVLHIRQVINGVSFTSNDGTSLNEIIDPTIVAALIRNVYETVGMFNLIYRHTKTEDEKLILYNLWAISGLNYRQRFESLIITEENEQKLKDEKQHIDRLISEIENTKLYISLDNRDKSKLQSKIKEKDFKIRFNNNQVVFLHWQELCESMGIKFGMFDKIYTYFSLYSHPSNVAVFQFGEMFYNDDKAFLDLTNFNLKNLFVFLSIFVADYIHLFPNVLNTFESLPLISQLVLNGQNKLARGTEYSINDTWQQLG